MQVGPHDCATDPGRCAQQMMMVVPVNADKHEAQHVDQQRRETVAERAEAPADRSPESERGDGDDHGQDAVAEGLKPGGLLIGGPIDSCRWWFSHGAMMALVARRLCYQR